MSRKSQKDIAYEYIKEKIISSDFKQGQPILEQEVADLLNISRTPVREALKALEVEGLINIFPYQGTIVSYMSTDDVKEIFELSKLIETWALKKSIQYISEEDLNEFMSCLNIAIQNEDINEYMRIDHDFHALIVEKSRSARAKRMHEMINSQIERIRRESTRNIEDIKASHNEHFEIIEYIRQKDAKKAVASLQRHLDRVEANMMKNIQK